MLTSLFAFSLITIVSTKATSHQQQMPANTVHQGYARTDEKKKAPSVFILLRIGHVNFAH